MASARGSQTSGSISCEGIGHHQTTKCQGREPEAEEGFLKGKKGKGVFPMVGSFSVVIFIRKVSCTLRTSKQRSHAGRISMRLRGGFLLQTVPCTSKEPPKGELYGGRGSSLCKDAPWGDMSSCEGLTASKAAGKPLHIAGATSLAGSSQFVALIMRMRGPSSSSQPTL